MAKKYYQFTILKGAIGSPPLICCYAPHIYCYAPDMMDG